MTDPYFASELIKEKWWKLLDIKDKRLLHLQAQTFVIYTTFIIINKYNI